MKQELNKNDSLNQRNYSVKVMSLGGFGDVTRNMFVYETLKDLIIVDCGVSFPKEEMLGVDLVIPDISYLDDKKNKIRAIILTHGHDDHIGGLPYILPQLPKGLPVYGPKWAIALSRAKLEEFGLIANLNEVGEPDLIKLGDFTLEFVKVTHSIPDTYHVLISTPAGKIYHAADFKLDLTPVVGTPTNQGRISEIGKRGITCLLSDCLRSENVGFTPPEAKLSEMFESEISNTQGAFFVTTISSNVSRLKQAIDVSVRHHRYVVPVGLSIEKNLKLAQKLKYIDFPQNVLVNRKNVRKYPRSALTFLVAGSQGQVGSALDRIVAGEIESIRIQSQDKVVFSTDYIPGNETAIYDLINNIYRLGADVAYPDIRDNIHVSGHGSQGDLGKLMEMVKPQYLIPIGGEFRHMVAYKKLAMNRGFKENQVILPDEGQVTEFFANGRVQTGKKIEVRRVLVDALGVGDVGAVVLRDRKILSEEGMVIVVLPLDQNHFILEGEPEIVTRGFIYIKDNLQFLNQTKEKVAAILNKLKKGRADERFIRREIQGELENYFFETTGRRPMVLTVIVRV